MSRLALGDALPSFELPLPAGGSFSTAEVEGRPLAVVFSCNHCPYVVAWEDRINQIARDFAAEGLAVVAINANDVVSYPADAPEKMIERSRDKGFVFPYAYDESQEVARRFGAERTPEVFLFDRRGQLAYHGAVDDSRDPDGVEISYLRNAVGAVLAQGAPAVPETPPVGCTIKWKR